MYIAGYTPTGADTMYVFLVEKGAGDILEKSRKELETFVGK